MTEQTTPWTPGPWRREPYTSRGELIEAVYAPDRHDPNGVMMVGSAGSQPETEANARLIAAAPEMAELLEIWTHGDVSKWTERAEAFDRARALIARIRGGAS